MEKKKLYFVETNAYNMVISDDGEIRRMLVDNLACDLYDQKERAEDFLREDVEDDSSWIETDATVEELTSDPETRILAEIEKEI